MDIEELRIEEIKKSRYFSIYIVKGRFVDTLFYQTKKRALHHKAILFRTYGNYLLFYKLFKCEKDCYKLIYELNKKL